MELQIKKNRRGNKGVKNLKIVSNGFFICGLGYVVIILVVPLILTVAEYTCFIQTPFPLARAW